MGPVEPPLIEPASPRTQIVATEPDPAGGATALFIDIGTAALLAAAALLWRRRQADDQPPRRFLRIFYAAALLGATSTVSLLVAELRRAGPRLEFLPMTAVGLAVLTAIALVIVAIADFWFSLFRPRRTRRWLVAAMVIFPLYLVICLTAALWIGNDLEALLEPGLLAVVSVGAAVGLVWWAWLPAPDPDLARRFD